MKVYVVTKMEHSYDYKRPETNHTIAKIYRNKEKTYMRLYKHVTDGENGEEDEGDDDEENTRVDKDESWKVSYGKLIEVFDEVLPEPEFSIMASHTRYLVKEHTLE
ncbi:hypothetical protein BGZ88_007596 [Linnemannia elongata]|nr:hypothetical protein BGZ88_007596 [Linnemannia elongata]